MDLGIFILQFFVDFIGYAFLGFLISLVFLGLYSTFLAIRVLLKRRNKFIRVPLTSVLKDDDEFSKIVSLNIVNIKVIIIPTIVIGILQTTLSYIDNETIVPIYSFIQSILMNVELIFFIMPISAFFNILAIVKIYRMLMSREMSTDDLLNGNIRLCIIPMKSSSGGGGRSGGGGASGKW